MLTKIKNSRIVLVFQLFLIVAIFGLRFFNFKNSKAEVFDCDKYLKNSSVADINCDQLEGNNKDECEKKDKAMKTYCDIVEMKSKQGNTLQKLMTLIDTEQARTQSELISTKSQAEELAAKISDLERDISYKEDLISYQRLMLIGMMQSYYEYYQQGVLDLVLINRDFSAILNQADYLQQTSTKVNEILDDIQKAKAELESEQNDLEQKKQESEKLKQELEDKNLNLQYTENQKQSLLTQTQGEEAKYQQLLARVEAAKIRTF